MTHQEILNRLKEEFPDIELALDETVPEPVLTVPTANLVEIATKLRDDPDLKFDCLMCLSGLDMPEDELRTVYHLFSMQHRHRFIIRCIMTREDPLVPTVSGVWSTADWHEREAWDLLGIEFEHHPDPRRILGPDDWEGHPLRKDYVPQEEWHGIPLTNLKPGKPGGGTARGRD